MLLKHWVGFLTCLVSTLFTWVMLWAGSETEFLVSPINSDLPQVDQEEFKKLLISCPVQEARDTHSSPLQVSAGLFPVFFMENMFKINP